MSTRRVGCWAAPVAGFALVACAGEAPPSSGSGGQVASAGAAGTEGVNSAGAMAMTQAGQAAVSGGSGGASATAGGTAGAGGSGLAGAGVGGSGGGGQAGAAGSGGYPPVEPPISDEQSTLPIANPGSKYQVDGNLPYGPLPRQRLDVMYPQGGGPAASASLPGVIMFHGGGWIQGDKATMSSFYSRFLAHGFVVCTVEYRVADDSGAIAPAAVEDALLAAQWFWRYLDYYHVDRERYVVTGASAGGHLALMVGMATPAANLGPTSPGDYRIAAIVNGYGPTDVADLLERGTSFATQWLPEGTPNRTALAQQVSPVTYARQDMAPLLTVHGTSDNTVPVAQAEALDALLQAAGADATLHLVAGAGHGFTTPASAWPDAEAAIFGFLSAHDIGQ